VRPQEKTASGLRFALQDMTKTRAGCANRRTGGKNKAQIETICNLSKSFQPSAKPTCLCVRNMHVGNALAMAADMLLLEADEVARNGAFGKILRPEVFPNAPCIAPFVGYHLSTKARSARFLGPPPRVLFWNED
jgi:hypothetical protein